MKVKTFLQCVLYGISPIIACSLIAQPQFITCRCQDDTGANILTISQIPVSQYPDCGSLIHAKKSKNKITFASPLLQDSDDTAVKIGKIRVTACSPVFDCSCTDKRGENSVQFNAGSAEKCQSYQVGSNNPNAGYQLKSPVTGSRTCKLGTATFNCGYTIKKVHPENCKYIPLS